MISLAQSTLLVAVAAPWIAALAIFALGEKRAASRTVVGVLLAATASAGAIGVAVVAAAAGERVWVGVPLLGTHLALAADRLGALFAVVAAVLWLVTTVYATGYMAHARDRARFFGFFAICVGSAIGVALSANLLTLFIFYEALTLATYPLVVHSGSDAAIRGGRTYLLYALSGGAVLLVGIVWLYALGGGSDFSAGGSLDAGLVAASGGQLSVVFALLIAGFGVKAALFPAHGWLPAAMVAPAPVSALLHAVAVVKAGVFGIARVMLDVYGLDVARGLGVTLPLAALAAFTIIFASVRALAQDDIKKRLAYSTVSQLSYIVLGLAIATPVAAAAAVAHLAHHAALKITMFFTAGTLAEELGVYRVSEMDGVGRRMPITMTAFSVAVLGIVGVPPIAGFVTKWGLGLGAVDGGDLWVLAVLGLSSLLNAAYLFPMLGRAWLGVSRSGWRGAEGPEGDRRLVWPLALTAAVGLSMGVFAAGSYSPARWAAAIVDAPASLSVPWFAGQFALDEPGRAFLVLALVVWGACALGSWSSGLLGRRRYAFFFLLAAAGSVGLAFAAGGAAFYLCFSVMALSTWGLVSYAGDESAKSGGRAYLAFTLLAEGLLLAGLQIGSVSDGGVAAVLASSPWLVTGSALILGGLGVKIAMFGVHGWMPLSYSVTPGPVAAAVAGVVSSAGVLGMIRLLPGGEPALVGLAVWCMAGGLIAAFWGAAVGVVQTEPRVVLAYSSMSQFGLMTLGLGAGLASGEVWPAAAGAAAAYMLHHGLAKAALFSVGDARGLAAKRPAMIAVALALPALALTGAPLTSGGVAKVALKKVVALGPAPWAHLLEIALPWAAVGTTLLVVRYVYLVIARTSGETEARPVAVRAGRLAGAALLLVATAGVIWVWPLEQIEKAAHYSLTAEYLWVLSWPPLLGLALGLAVWVLRPEMLTRAVGKIPAGDLWAGVLSRADSVWLFYQERLAEPPRGSVDEEREATSLLKAFLGGFAAIESYALRWSVAAATIVLLLLVLMALTL